MDRDGCKFPFPVTSERKREELEEKIASGIVPVFSAFSLSRGAKRLTLGEREKEKERERERTEKREYLLPVHKSKQEVLLNKDHETENVQPASINTSYNG